MVIIFISDTLVFPAVECWSFTVQSDVCAVRHCKAVFTFIVALFILKQKHEE